MLPVEVTLLGNTKRLKQLIKEHGDRWISISHEPIPMQCFNNELGIHVMNQDGSHSRNVRMVDIDISLFDIDVNI